MENGLTDNSLVRDRGCQIVYYGLSDYKVLPGMKADTQVVNVQALFMMYMR